MFYFKLKKLHIRDNRKFIGKADVKLMSFITSSDHALPDIDGFFATNAVAEKKAIIENAVKVVLASKITPKIERIHDNQTINFGTQNQGIILYKTQEIPIDFSWTFIAVRDSSRERTNAELALQIVQDDSFNDLISNIGIIAGAAANPAFTAGAMIVKFVAETTLKVLAESKDREIGIVLTSFIGAEDYPDGDGKGNYVPDATGNMHYYYSIFSHEVLPV